MSHKSHPALPHEVTGAAAEPHTSESDLSSDGGQLGLDAIAASTERRLDGTASEQAIATDGLFKRLRSRFGRQKQPPDAMNGSQASEAAGFDTDDHEAGSATAETEEAEAGSLRATAANLLAAPESERADVSIARRKEALFYPDPAVEGNKINVIDSRDIGRFDIYAKLTPARAAQIRHRLAESDANPARGEFAFTDKDGNVIHTNGNRFSADVYQIGEGITARLGDGGTANFPNDKFKMQSMDGLLRLEINAETHGGSPQDVERALRTALQAADLDYENRRNGHDTQSYGQRIIERYSAGDAQAQLTAGQVKLKQLPDGAIVPAITGLHEAYDQAANGIQVISHETRIEQLPDIIKNNALYSTIERYERGLPMRGRSSANDIAYGGGDLIYTHCFSGEGTWPDKPAVFASNGYAQLVFCSQVLDRLDVRAYDGDAYGSDQLADRVPPREFFSGQHMRGVHELDFENNLPLADVRRIVVKEDAIQPTIDALRSQGIGSINGMPLEKVVCGELYNDDIRKINGTDAESRATPAQGAA